MKLAGFDWFGWSILWLAPLIWSLIRTRFSGKPLFGGQGSIRLWLGTILIIGASSALEASIRMSDAIPPDMAGQALAGFLGAAFGKVGGMLAMMTIIVLALPWLFGASLLGLATSCLAMIRRIGGGKQPESNVQWSRRIARSEPVRKSATTQQSTAATGVEHLRRTESWHPADTRTMSDVNDKKRERIVPAVQPVPRKMAQWAEVERIIPTAPMLSRITPSLRGGSANKAPTTERILHQVHRTQTSSIRIIRTRPDGQMTVHVDSVTDASILLETAATVSAVPPDAMPVDFQPVPYAGNMDAELSAALIALPYPPAESVTASYRQSAGERWGTVIDNPPENSSGDPWLVTGIASHAPLPPSSTPSTSRMQPVDDEREDLDATVVEPIPAPFNVSQSLASQEQNDFAFHSPRGLHIDLPGLDLLDSMVADVVPIDPERLAETGQLIEQRLREFKVPVTVIGANAGPVITRFEVEPALGVRGSQIVSLTKDLSRALGMTSIRVVETIPGKTCMGLELPNTQRQMIRLSEILASNAYQQSASPLTLAMGKDITGNPLVVDLARAPHMLVAGTTGSGKSVAINAMILSLLYKATPADVRMIMIDPKMLELSVYEGIPHLLAPVVTDMKLAANALSWCVTEMDKRYRLMSALGVRNLNGFNQKILDGERREKKITNPFSLTPDAPEPLSTLPLIVVIIDELADLMMVAGKKIEEPIARLAQKARAAGIHLILATQRPSVDVITGLIKANIPTRVAFQVSSKIDSRTILDQMGAETLLGHGDMLFLPPGSGYPQRVHGAFVSDEEVHRVVEFLKQFGEPEYEEAILAGVPAEAAEKSLPGETQDAEADPLYDEAVAFVVRSRRASISSVQRQLRVGYNRAARLVEQMEAAGILSSMATNGSRDVLAPPIAD